MAYTLKQLSELEAAIASGTRVVMYDGKRVEYQTTADMLKARDLIRGELIVAGLLSVPLTNRGPATRAEFDRRN